MRLPCRFLLIAALALPISAQAADRASPALTDEPVLPADPKDPRPDTRNLPVYENYAPTPRAYIVGVDITSVRQHDGKTFFNSLRPLYADPDHPTGEPTAGQPFLGNGDPGRHVVTRAKPGYAVAAVVYHQNITVLDGYRVVFARVAGNRLDTSDAYTSPWVGTKGKIVSDSHGTLVRGLRATVGNDLHTINVLTEVPNDPTPAPVADEPAAVPAAPAPAAKTRAARPYAYHEPDPARAPFSAERLKLPADARINLATTLAQYAVAHDLGPATPKLLGVAMAVDPENRTAVLTNAALKRGTFKPATRPADDKDPTAIKDILSAAAQAKATKSPADLALAACLYDLVLTLQPAQDEALYQSELLRHSRHAPDWVWAVGAPTASAAPGEAPAAADAKPFARNQTSVNGLSVITGDDGQHYGQVLEMILTISPPTGRGGPDVQLAGKTGPEMRTALDEAVRTVKVRYPVWERKNLVISFNDKYTPKDGGSAGTAFGLLLLSSLEGWDIDPHFAVTGDITVDGKVRGIGGVDAKVRGAVADGCSLVAVPAENAERIADYLVLYQPKALADIQIFAAATLADATDLAKLTKPDKLSRAIDLFSEFQSAYKAAPSPATFLASADAKAKLEGVLELAPNHLSAKYLLQCAEGKQPRRLSVGMSLYRMALATNQFIESLKDAKQAANRRLPESVFNDAIRQLRSLRAIAADETFNTLTTFTEFIEALQRYNRHSLSLPEVNRRFNAWRAALSKLEANPDTMAKLLREGV